ncbi:MAG: hypothetical protein ABS34_03090 [Opitutaceae bacterium BACL24 MAG-120322-bin51]|jgi:hypothetical protein|nr:MAG: hypothetical protein ABS34_03090 [Opitutaceae bacterium BACL24 MAG-120322-bin51]
MKQKTHLKVLLIATLALFGATYSYAAAGHDHGAHDHGNGGHSHGATKPAAQEPQGGPNGGRLITIVEPHLEFWVTPERFVQITFLGRDGEFVAVGEQVVSAIGGDRSAPTKVEFVKDEGRLISTAALPEMKRMPIILQIKTTPDAKRMRETFYLNMSDCPGCDYKEYACICGH